MEKNIALQRQIEIMVAQADATINDADRDRLRLLLSKYSDVISIDEMDLGRTDMIEHAIDTGSARPTRQTLRRVPLSHQKLIDDQVELMLKQDLIKPANSEWASNVVLVRKKDDSWRFCIDYRSVNTKTIKDAHPLPRISDCIESLIGSKYFTTLDMRSGFFRSRSMILTQI